MGVEASFYSISSPPSLTFLDFPWKPSFTFPALGDFSCGWMMLVMTFDPGNLSFDRDWPSDRWFDNWWFLFNCRQGSKTDQSWPTIYELSCWHHVNEAQWWYVIYTTHVSRIYVSLISAINDRNRASFAFPRRDWIPTSENFPNNGFCCNHITNVIIVAIIGRPPRQHKRIMQDQENLGFNGTETENYIFVVFPPRIVCHARKRERQSNNLDFSPPSERNLSGLAAERVRCLFAYLTLSTFDIHSPHRSSTQESNGLELKEFSKAEPQRQGWKYMLTFYHVAIIRIKQYAPQCGHCPHSAPQCALITKSLAPQDPQPSSVPRQPQSASSEL